MLKFSRVPNPCPFWEKRRSRFVQLEAEVGWAPPLPISGGRPLKRPRNPRWPDPSVRPRRTRPCSGPHKLWSRKENPSRHELSPPCPQLPKTACCSPLGPWAAQPRGPAKVAATRGEKRPPPCSSQAIATVPPGQPSLWSLGNRPAGRGQCPPGPPCWALTTPPLPIHPGTAGPRGPAGGRRRVAGQPRVRGEARSRAGCLKRGGPAAGAGCRPEWPCRPSPSLGGRRGD